MMALSREDWLVFELMEKVAPLFAEARKARDSWNRLYRCLRRMGVDVAPPKHVEWM